MVNDVVKKILLNALFVAALFFSVAAPAESRFGRIVVFGDSLTDSGNAFFALHQVSLPPYQLIPSAPYPIGGLHFSNGPTWVEQLARQRHINTVCPSLLIPGGCTDYAVGGARARPGGAFDLSSQVGLFLNDFHGAVPSGALYVVEIGGNDIRDALEALRTDPSGATSIGILTQTVTVIANNIVTLTSAGAREFMVPNAPNLSLVPAVRLQGPQAQAAAQMLSAAFNNALENALTNLEAGLHVTIHRFDVFTLLTTVVANPSAYNFVDAQNPCITPGVVAHARCTQPDEFVFWDGLHPTRAAHALLATQANAILN